MRELAAHRVHDIARVCHEANRALQTDLGEDVNPPWDQSPQWMKDSTVNGVEGVLAGNTPEQSHENWMKVRAADGWVYGEIKDEAAKTHPCMVPYADLPAPQRLKDELFGQVVLIMELMYVRNDLNSLAETDF